MGADEVHLLLGVSATKRCRKRGASEFAGVELLDILDAGFFLNVQFNKTQLTPIFFFFFL